MSNKLSQILGNNGYVEPKVLEPQTVTKKGLFGSKVVADPSDLVNQAQQPSRLTPADQNFFNNNKDLSPEEYMQAVVDYVHTSKRFELSGDDTYSYRNTASRSVGDCSDYAGQMSELLAERFGPTNVSIVQGRYVFELENGKNFVGQHAGVVVDHDGQAYFVDNNLDGPVPMDDDMSMSGQMGSEKPEFEGDGVKITLFEPDVIIPKEGDAVYYPGRDYDSNQHKDNFARLRDKVIPDAQAEQNNPEQDHATPAAADVPPEPASSAQEPAPVERAPAAPAAAPAA